MKNRRSIIHHTGLPLLSLLILASCGNSARKQQASEDSFFSATAVIPPFSFTDQDGMPFTQDSVAGKVYVADFFFSSCKTICPKMTDALKVVQHDLASYQDFRIVSHTLDPENDSIPRLKAYGEEHGAQDGTWYFLTGARSEIYGLAHEAYKMAVAKGAEVSDTIIHSSRLILVGRDGVVVDYFDAESDKEVRDLISKAKQLLDITE